MKLRYIFLGLCAAAAVTAAAEEPLSKEITIEREIVPEVRAASRLNVYPRALSFKPQVKELSISNFTEAAEIDPSISRHEPAATVAAAPPTPWRGYLDLGYFPAANAALSAGYAIVETSATSLNAWAQLNNRSYKAAPQPGLEKETFRHLLGRIGVDFSHAFGEAGTLSLATDFGYSSFLQPWSVLEKSIYGDRKAEGQSVAEWNLSAMWHGTGSNDLSYHAGADFGIFNFSKGIEQEVPAGDASGMTPYSGVVTIPAVHQTSFGLDLGVEQKINSESSAGVDLTGDFLSYNHFADGSGKTFGVASLKPFYRFGNNLVTLKAGVRLDITANYGKAVHVAPDVLLGVNPASGFGAWLRVGGGEHLNTLQELQAFSPYISQLYAYGVSHLPVTGDIGLRFGPVHGASLTLKLAYAAANDWLLPAMTGDNQLVFLAHDLRSWKAGAQLNWKFRNLLVLDASFESTVGNGEKETWVEWRDRARHVLSAALTVHPVSRLSVDVTYQLRMKRSMPQFDGMSADAPDEIGLKDTNNLGVGAAWRFTDALSVFARVDNVLGTKTYLLPFVPDQGLTGLVGVAWKF